MTIVRKLSVVQLHIKEDGRLFPVYQLLQRQQNSTSSAAANPNVTMTQAEETRPVLPESLESIPKADYFPNQRHRWNTNEEIASLLISFERHEDWLSKEVKIRPKSGSMLLYSRKRVRYRRDGYCWKKRKDGKTTREDHMKLKVQGTECIYGCYVHSAILPTFHRRCYWLLQNPDIVLVHYLNVPYSDDNKLLVTPSLSYCADKKEWTKEELVSQLKPMFYSENEPDLNNELEISTAETVEAIVQQLMEKQRAKSTARTHECACDNNAKGNASADKKCSHTFHRIISPKTHSRGVLAAVSTAAANSTTVSNTSTTPASSTTTTVLTTQTTSIKSEETPAKRATVSATVAVTGVTPRPGSVILAPCRPILQDGKHEVALTTGNHGSGGGSAAATSLILNLSQLQGGGGLLILNSATAASGVGLTSASVTPVTFLCGQDTSAATAVRNLTTHTLTNAMDTSDGPNIAKPIKKSPNIKSEVEEGLESALKRDVHFSNVPTNKDPDLCSVMEELSSETKDLPMNLFEDTLAMSHDEIQRTLLANMPPPKYVVQDSNPQISVKLESSHQPDNVIVDLNPMDFIDNDISTPDEEVFNMDTFDILSDLPNLDDLNPDLAPSSGLSSSNSSTPVSNGSFAAKTNHSAMDYREGTANITDYSPDWCYTEGGVKVLVTGPWYSSSSPYTILFDGVSVPTTLVQSGVLRCYSPAHETGLVSLQVACEGFVISNSVFFEYRQRQSATNVKSEDWFSVEDSTLKLSLLERLEIMETKLTFSLDGASAGLTTNSVVQNANDEQKSFEDRLVSLCQKFMTGNWTRPDDVSPMLTTTCSDLTLLHLAAALGFSRLACTLLHWRNDNSSLMLEREVDAMSQDKRGNTPLMWACALGFSDVALLLYQWNRAAIKVTNNRGVTPLTVASERGHESLVDQIEKLEWFKITVRSNETDLNAAAKLDDSSLSKAMKPPSLDNMLMNNASTSVKARATNPKESQQAQSQRLSSSVSTFSSSEVLDPPNLESQSYSLHLNESSLMSFLNVLQTNSRDRFNMNPPKPKKDISTSPPVLTENTSEKPKSSTIDIIPSDEELDGQFSTAATEGSTLSSRRDSCSSCDLPLNSEADNRVLTLAEHIIAAMPDRIKASANTDPEDPFRSSEDFSEGDGRSLSMSQNPLDLDMCSIDDSSPPLLNEEFNFDHTYRYCETNTPVSSLSPASSSCLQSPSSFTLDSPSPPPTTADFCEFFQASGKIMEKDFSKLTLSDKEQRELYEAAKIIQKAYRSYKGRKRQEEQEKEKAAATLIQTYYRRYKQYMYYKQMTKAAQLIQSQFRNYCEHKRFKKWKESDADCISPALGSSPSPSAASLQSLYWTLAESERRLSSSREGTPTSSSTLKRTYSQRRQHQAARKIQQFLRQSKNKLQRERALAAEREKLPGEAQSLPPLRLKYQEQPSDKKLPTDVKNAKCDKENT
ncbi:calmodulin-binding transcription activator 2 isoform X4 [Parasteatoda tepidariorum]|uniref:calmodulin-binding transcription activator 2 isoform X4 n=1 Tax=Parasteatoda tepidariorum TaxID=114398 RepID=UPI0039BD1F27